MSALRSGWFGFLFETVADWQLTRFKANPDNQGKVMDRGLWRNTRHPNYFGEACLWWGFWLIAASAGGWWTMFSPLLMTVLLLKVSGVALLEKDISERRPAYRDYIARTNAFFPGRTANAPGRRSPHDARTFLVDGAAYCRGRYRVRLDGEWRFRVFLDDAEIGYHRFSLLGDGPEQRNWKARRATT